MENIIQLKITEINTSYDDTLCLTLREVNNRITEFNPGQFLTLLIEVNGEQVRRGFSISSSPDELPDIKLAIKKVDDGVISNHVFGKIKIGDVLQAFPPHGNFTIIPDTNNERHIVMFGAGSGITPLFSQLKSVLKNEPKSKVTLHYGNRRISSIIYKNEIDSLSELYADRFFVHYYLTNPDADWPGLKGRITKEAVEKFLVNSNDAIGAKVEYYMCGPDAMMKDICSTLKSKGIPSKKIHREVYHATVIDENEDVEKIPREVTIIYKGVEYKLTVNPEKSILITALEAGLELPNSCQYGSCASCKAKLLSGQMQLFDQSALSEEDLERGFCLTCIGHPVSDNVVILYEDAF